jgi:hypothetical protein
MKLVTALMATGATATPLVSFQGVVDLAVSSTSLGYDIVNYGNDKFTDALPNDYRALYKKFRSDLKQYVATYVTPITDKAKVHGTAFGKPVVDVLSLAYQQVDGMTKSFLDPIIFEFERRYPAHAGAIGPSLADRLVLVAWIYLFIRVIRRVTCRGCCQEGKNKCC